MAQPREAIVSRLLILPDVVGKKTIKEMLELTSCSETRWQNYISPKQQHIIAWEIACELKVVYGITLDWIYCNDLVSLPMELRTKVRLAEKQTANEMEPPRRRRAKNR